MNLRGSESSKDARPDSPRRRKTIGWLVFLLLLSGLGTGIYLAYSHLIEWYIRKQLVSASERLGREVDFGQFELERLNLFHFHDLVIREPGEQSERELFTASRLSIGLNRTQMFMGSIVLREIALENPVLHLRDYPDGSSNYYDLFEPILRNLGLAEPQPTEQEQPAASEPRLSRRAALVEKLLSAGMPRLVITGGRLDLSSMERLNLPVRSVDFALQVEPTGNDLACRFELSADIEAVEIGLLARPVRHINLSGQVDLHDQVAQLTISTGEPIELVPFSDLPDVRVRLGNLGFEYPYSLSVGGIEVLDRRTRSSVVSIPNLVVSLRELTTNPSSLYLSKVEAHGIRVHLEVDRRGRTNIDRLLGLAEAPLENLVATESEEPPMAQSSEESREDTRPSPSTPPVVEARRPTAWEQELIMRRWWEIIPQTTEFTDISIEILVHEGSEHIRTLDLNVARLSASKRLYNFQMDLSTELTLSERNGGGVGTIGVEVMYYYGPGHWDIEVFLSQLDLNQILDIMPFPNPFGIDGGQLNGELSMRDRRPQRSLELDLELQLDDLAFSALSLAEHSIELPSIHYQAAGAYSDSNDFTMQLGALRFGETVADVRLDLVALQPLVALDYLAGFGAERDQDYFASQVGRPTPYQVARLQVDMPRQPIMNVFNSIPFAFRDRLEGTVMIGDVGWQLDVQANYQRASNGRLSVDIPRPRVARVLDEGVELIQLPFEVDVRRLLEGFTFTFSDGIGEMRLITIGPENPRWVTLEEISPFLVRSILYTEDQGFWENDGFNWLQMRSVIANVLANQSLGRGASTISMQLIKNVFLSRERLISRKITEMFLTHWLTFLVPKERILEVYLNVIEFGPAVNGASEAAEYYFGKRASDLNLAEAIFLVSIVPNPRMYHFFYEQGAITNQWWTHMQRYLRRMVGRNLISQEEFDQAISQRPEFYIRTEGAPPLRPEPFPEEFLLPFLE